MIYLPQHAEQALEIMQRCAPLVPPRCEYSDLLAILQTPNRWKEAHEQFSAIRTRVTLPLERQKKKDAATYFVFVAELAAKTAYNCTDPDDPFDDDSFEWLLRCERELLNAVKKEANQSPQTIPHARDL